MFAVHSRDVRRHGRVEGVQSMSNRDVQSLGDPCQQHWHCGVFTVRSRLLSRSEWRAKMFGMSRRNRDKAAGHEQVLQLPSGQRL
jgi:hypothetical protein